MRSILAGSALCLVLALPVHAQQNMTNGGTQAATFFNGVNPRNIKFQPIDTSAAMATFNSQKAFRAPRAPSSFSLSNVFHKISLGSWPPKTASAPIMPSYSTQFQPNPLAGRNVFTPSSPTK